MIIKFLNIKNSNRAIRYFWLSLSEKKLLILPKFTAIVHYRAKH